MDAPVWGGPSQSQQRRLHSGSGSARPLRCRYTCTRTLFLSALRWLSLTWQRRKAQDLWGDGGQQLISELQHHHMYTLMDKTNKKLQVKSILIFNQNEWKCMMRFKVLGYIISWMLSEHSLELHACQKIQVLCTCLCRMWDTGYKWLTAI